MKNLPRSASFKSFQRQNEQIFSYINFWNLSSIKIANDFFINRPIKIKLLLKL